VYFAPLCSQGKGEREKWIAERQGKHAHQPKPCSPKSIYTLADKVRKHQISKSYVLSLTIAWPCVTSRSSFRRHQDQTFYQKHCDGVVFQIHVFVSLLLFSVANTDAANHDLTAILKFWTWRMSVMKNCVTLPRIFLSKRTSNPWRTGSSLIGLKLSMRSSRR
jgi:hypothetical protein